MSVIGVNHWYDSEVDERANKSYERARHEKVSDSALRWQYERKEHD
jgi:hypothetical protein